MLKKAIKGFTLVEMVMVILLLAILAAVALPNFIDLRTDARNAATQGALGGFRSAISIARAAIALREATTAPDYPSLVELQKNTYQVGTHPVLAGGTTPNIMDASSGVPINPWSLSTIPIAEQASVFDCTGLAKATLRTVPNNIDYGWCYNATNGQVWANSDKNGSTPTENNY